ncbi:hypothetical protein MX652_08610 [Thauera aromatica]|nr:hypothetical protein [Thauera aromatica]MCK2126748.1 hypothetical protein [Thauera aromatica]
MTTITFDWKFFATLLAAVAGVVAPILLWQFDISSRSLSVRLVSSVALQPETGPSVQDIQIVLAGVKIESPYLSTLELTNDGSKPISASDFEGSIEVRLNKDSQVVRARISSSQPSNIPAALSTGKNVVKLQPLLLNPKDTLTFAIITSGGPPIFEPQARIAGVSKILYEDSTTKNSGWKRAILLLPLSLLSFVLYTFFAVSLVRPNTVSVSRLVALGTMLVCGVSSSVLLRRGYQAIDLDDSALNMSAFLVVAVVVATPVFFRQMRRSRRPQSVV